MEHVVVATDDKRIFDCVNQFGGNVVMTKSEHQTGTDRCLEAFLIWTKNNVINPSVILNIQGDEPMLCEEHLLKVIDCFEDSSTTMASLAAPTMNNNNNNNTNPILDSLQNVLLAALSPDRDTQKNAEKQIKRVD